MPSQVRRQIKRIVGGNIRSAREAKGLTQKELARMLPGDVESPSVSRWESGKVMPGLTYLSALGDALDRNLSWFYVDHDSLTGHDDPDLAPAA